MSNLKYFDSHAHYEDGKYDSDRDEVIQKVHAQGVEYIINVGSDLKTSKESIRLARKYEYIYAAVGIHPHEVKDACSIEELREVCRAPKIVAVGETGLDYYYDHSPRDMQKIWFKNQIELANDLCLPVIIHDRDAHGDCLDIVKKVPPVFGGVFHCFSGSVEMAHELLRLGFHISFGGPVTFSNARRILEVVQGVPIDRMLIETDAPYLAPEPFRGKRNDSGYLKYIAAKIAEVKGVSEEEATKVTSENAKRLFGIYEKQGER